MRTVAGGEIGRGVAGWFCSLYTPSLVRSADLLLIKHTNVANTRHKGQG
jgi:hypothetical protein